MHRCISFYSYIKPQPVRAAPSARPRCISFYSYIKPQRCSAFQEEIYVVYRSIPTSNRNSWQVVLTFRKVVYRSIPTSNRNVKSSSRTIDFVVYRSIPTSNRNVDPRSDCGGLLYIVLFLHQTATRSPPCHSIISCISFYSYIKPQLADSVIEHVGVVYRSIPTSNRNNRIY
mgnify:CR=1 FL=1